MKEMNIKNLKITAACIGLGACLAFSNPVSAHAATNDDEEVLYEETRENEGRVHVEPITEIPDATSYVQPVPTEEPKPSIDPASINGDCIDGDNYVVPEGRGDKIPEGEPTEWQRKFGKPEDKPEDKPQDKPSNTPTNTGTPAQLAVNTPVAAPKTGDASTMEIVLEYLAYLASGAGIAAIGTAIDKSRRNFKIKKENSKTK